MWDLVKKASILSIWKNLRLTLKAHERGGSEPDILIKYWQRANRNFVFHLIAVKARAIKH